MSPASSVQDVNRKLSIKINVIKRCAKDIVAYERELSTARARLTQLTETADVCPHVLKKQGEVVAETEAILPDCRDRLHKAQADLQEFLRVHSDTPFSDEALETAHSVLTAE